MGAFQAIRATWAGVAAAILGVFMPAAAHAATKPTPIVLWFNATLRVMGAPPGEAVTICAKRQVVSWSEGRQTISIAIPDATLSFKPWETESQTWFGGGKWDTSLPAGAGSVDTFLSGIALPLPTGLSALARGMAWRVQFESDTPGITVQWNWGAAPYLKFAADYNALKVVPANLRNAERAGTPSALKAFALLPGDDRGVRFIGPRSGNVMASAPKTFGCGGGY